MSNKLEEISKTMKNNGMAELMDVMSNIYEETVVGKKNSTLPEVVFVEYFLDFFKSGMTTPDKDLKYAKWIELSGSPYNEVDIIDLDSKIIFTVPPLYAKPAIDPSIIDINFSNIGSTYIMKSNRLQTDADNYLNEKLQPVANKINDDSAAIVARWQEIFKRYTQPEVNTTKIEENVPYMSNILDDEIEY